MSFLLSSQNVFEYLEQHNISTQVEEYSGQIEHKVARNFNLLLSLPDNRTIIIKQECYRPDGKTTGGFINEWRIQEFLQQFPSLNHLHPFVPELIHFNETDSIIIFNYLKEHCDLIDFYTKSNVFPPAIASAIGSTIAAFHRATLNHQEYRDFFGEGREDAPLNGGIPYIIRKFDRISPEIFGQVPGDGLKFFALYQRYDSLRDAIAELTDTIMPYCLTHNDLKLNNILLHNNWQQILAEKSAKDSVLRIIDWERCSWGDPAFDIGMLVGSYLLLWLKSLVVSKSIDIEDSLRMAVTPLENLQPSIAALVSTYFANFPEILEYCPRFLHRVMRFSGLALILHIQATLQHRKTFGNTGICILQVAQGLLCSPEQFMSAVFGAATSEIVGLQPALT
ncbi:aminoglycoside phosphotransferase family protein (plasmid) [Tolypothrix sp. PCC 7910]|uniref:aminoglycoside phosphotransferase family protein n=1 Tax=Tolypothrix sp. PCC 7910 TaxID=2099387 RepID=UPI0014279D06|nr:aminoglycoside phosphotransferase family protein [Tolypothrix sp. PCC 7910]QIR41861.1 aminoglycoside phosphotransferase family protein [Tolypothrix sp. PCC 7910]